MEGRYIAPGYIDLHVRGGGGADYMGRAVRWAFERLKELGFHRHLIAED